MLYTYTHTHTVLIVANRSSSTVEGVGEDSLEDKPYCDVSMDEVIPAVKTLIREIGRASCRERV